MTKFFTKEGLEKLKRELEDLSNVKKKELSEKLKNITAQGDLSENSAYDIAREELSFIERKIQELKETIAQAEVINDNLPPAGKIAFGSTVFLKSEEGKEKYKIVGSEEADILSGKISDESPLGKSLLGKKKNDIAEIITPAGKKKYKILKIE